MSNQIKELRSTLKSCIHAELEKLPETLESLEPKQRLDILVKLMPYAMPKNDNVEATYGEPSVWDLQQ